MAEQTYRDHGTWGETATSGDTTFSILTRMDLDLNNRRWSKTFIAYENPELINMLWGLAINPAGNKVVIHSSKHTSGKIVDEGFRIDNIWVVNTEDSSYVNAPLRVRFTNNWKLMSST